LSLPVVAAAAEKVLLLAQAVEAERVDSARGLAYL
jgi:hypothetical protein